MKYLDFAKAVTSVNWSVWKSCPMDRTGVTYRVHVADARDKDQEWGASGVSDWASSIFVVCYRSPECHQYDNAAFR